MTWHVRPPCAWHVRPPCALKKCPYALGADFAFLHVVVLALSQFASSLSNFSFPSFVSLLSVSISTSCQGGQVNILQVSNVKLKLMEEEWSLSFPSSVSSQGGYLFDDLVFSITEPTGHILEEFVHLRIVQSYTPKQFLEGHPLNAHQAI